MAEKTKVDGEEVQQVLKKKASVEIEVWYEVLRKRVQATEPVCFSSLLHVPIVSQITR